MTRFFLFFLLVSVAVSRASSQTLRSGILPSVTVSLGLPKNVGWTGKVESMQSFYDGESSGDPRSYTYIRTDIQNFLSYKAGPFSKAAAGYQYRFLTDGANSHRFIQQLSYVQRKRNHRLGHRLRMDQTFQGQEAPQYRFRYRLSAEIPLQGTAIDQGEYYLVVSDELLFITQDGVSEGENRIGLSLGNNFRDDRKLEVGLDYRADQFSERGVRNRLWLTISYYISH